MIKLFNTSMGSYNNLKDEIIREAGNNLNLEVIKNYFSHVINSKRSLSKAETLSDIIHLLENRDSLSCQNVTALYSVGDLLQNSEIKKYVRMYCKLYIDEDYPKCEVCGQDCSFKPQNLLPQEREPLSVVENEIGRLDANNNSNQDLDAAIENVASTIGPKWRTLASELNLRECQVDMIRQQYPSNYAQQARFALQIWKNTNGQNATLHCLEKALEARLCKLKGIGPDMLKPIIGLTS